jgi:hypothetical protein
MKTGTNLEWERFKRGYSEKRLKALEGNSELELALREDFVRAQEIAVKIIEGTSDYPPSLKVLMDCNTNRTCSLAEND